MSEWILIIAAPFIILLLFEEIVQFFWTLYVRGPKKRDWSRVKTMFTKGKTFINKYRKNLSH